MWSGGDVEAGVDRSEEQVEVEQYGFLLLVGGQAGRQVDRQRRAADSADRPRDRDDPRGLFAGGLRLIPAAGQFRDDLEYLGRFRGQREELARAGADGLQDQRTIGAAARGQHVVAGALGQFLDQLDGLAGIVVEDHDREVGGDFLCAVRRFLDSWSRLPRARAKVFLPAAVARKPSTPRSDRPRRFGSHPSWCSTWVES